MARCLIVAPGSLVDQWQDELADRFNLHFEILTRDMIEATRSHNPFAERPLLIARLDHLSRNEELHAKISTSDDWDLVWSTGPTRCRPPTTASSAARRSATSSASCWAASIATCC